MLLPDIKIVEIAEVKPRIFEGSNHIVQVLLTLGYGEHLMFGRILVQTSRIKLMGAGKGYFSGFGSFGNTIGKTGFIVSYLHKRADELGSTLFRLNDLSAKIRTGQLWPVRCVRVAFGLF